jgi:D-alanyl-D-alanine carboxypeptidase
MEGLMQNPANQQWLKHAGMKGGSTSFVLTKASYATDLKGNKTELAYFLYDLEPMENMMLQRKMNGFEYKLLVDDRFRESVRQIKP